MAAKKFSISSSLMQGLEDTITAAEKNSGELRFEVLKLDQIDLDDENPRDMKLSILDIVHGIKKNDEFFERKKKEKDDLQSLASSILSEGLINPIFVYQEGQRYKVLAGERRTLASWLAKKDTIQARISDRKPSRTRVAVLQWAENVERRDLNLLERRDNLIKIKEALVAQGEDNFDAKTIIKTLGCSTPQAYRYLALINADNELIKLIESNVVRTLKDAEKVGAAKDRKSREQLIEALSGNIELNKVLKKSTQTQAKNKPGRKQQRVNFGATKDLTAAQEIIEILLKDKRLRGLGKEIQDTEIGVDTLSKLFEKILKTLGSKEKA